jgi:carbon starvation protein
MKFAGYILWGLVSLIAALCLAGIATYRGEPINSIWIIVAAACTYAVGFRFYAKFIAARVMILDNQRATPAERLRDGHDFEPTNKWILFGHHFAAIAGQSSKLGQIGR